MIAFPRLQATVCQQELSTGATRPCVFTCQDATGQGAGDFVVKSRSEVRGQETGLLLAFLAAQLALRLGIPMPAPALIECDSLLADATPDAAIADRIRASVGLNFGTRFLAPGYVTWQTNDAIPLYLLLGKPHQEKLSASFVKAENMLHKMPCRHEFIGEDEAAKFAAAVEDELKHHNEEQ